MLSTVTVDANGNVVVEKNEVGENDGSEGGGKDVTSTLKRQEDIVGGFDLTSKSYSTSSAIDNKQINNKEHAQESVEDNNQNAGPSISSSSSHPKFDVEASLASLNRARALLGSLGNNNIESSLSSSSAATAAAAAAALTASRSSPTSSSSSHSSPGEVKFTAVTDDVTEDDHLTPHTDTNTLTAATAAAASSLSSSDAMNMSTSSYSSIVKRPYVLSMNQHHHHQQQVSIKSARAPTINPVRKRPSLSTILAEQSSSKMSSRSEGGGGGGGIKMTSLPLPSTSHLRTRKGTVDSHPMASLLQSPESYSLQLSGNLLKRSHHARTSATWAKRFFVTQRWHLLYYKDSQSSPDAPLAAIDLRCVRDLLVGDEVNIEKIKSASSSTIGTSESSSGGGWLANFLSGSSHYSSSSSSSSAATEIRCFLEIVLSSSSDDVTASTNTEDHNQQRQNYLLKAATETEALEWHDGLLSLLIRYGCDPYEGSLLEKKLFGGGGGGGTSRGIGGGGSRSSSNSVRYASGSPISSTDEEEYAHLPIRAAGTKESDGGGGGGTFAGVEEEEERGGGGGERGDVKRRLGILASVEAVLNGTSSSSTPSYSSSAASSSSSSLSAIISKGTMGSNFPTTSSSSFSSIANESIAPPLVRSSRSVDDASSSAAAAKATLASSSFVTRTSSSTDTLSPYSSHTAPQTLLSSSPTFIPLSSSSSSSSLTTVVSSSSNYNSSSASLPPIHRPRPSSEASAVSAILSACRILQNPPSALTTSLSSATLSTQRERAASLCSKLTEINVERRRGGDQDGEGDYFALSRALGGDLSSSVSEVFALIRSSPRFTQKLASEFVSAAKTFQFCSFLRRGPLGNSSGPFPILALHSEAQHQLSKQQQGSYVSSSSSSSPGDTLFANAITTQLMQWLAASTSPGDLSSLEKALEQIAEDVSRSIAAGFDEEISSLSNSHSRNNSHDDTNDGSSFEIFSFLLSRVSSDSFLTAVPPSVLLSMLITVAHRGRASAAESLAMQLLPVLESYWSSKLNIKKSIIDSRIRRLARAAGSGAPTVEKGLTTLLRIWSKAGFLLFDRLPPLLQADLALPPDWRDKVLEARGISSGASSSSSSIAASAVAAASSASSLRARLPLEISTKTHTTAHDLALLHSAIQRVLMSCADSHCISDDDEDRKKTLVGLSFNRIVAMDDIDEKAISEICGSASVINSLCELTFPSPQICILPSSTLARSKRVAGTQPLVALNRLDEAKATARQLKDCYDEAGIQIPTVLSSASSSSSSSSTFSLSDLCSNPLPHSIEAEIVTLSKRLTTLLPILDLASNESNALKDLIKRSEDELKQRQLDEAEYMIASKQQQQLQLQNSTKNPYPPVGEGKLTTVKQLVFASPPLPPSSSSGVSFSSRTLEQDQRDAAHAAARAVNTPSAYRLTSSSSTPLAASNAARAAMSAASVAALSVTKAPRLPGVAVATPLTDNAYPKSPLQALIGAGGVFSYTR